MIRTGRIPIFDPETLALAMELRTCNVSWKLLDRYLGSGIQNAVNYAMRTGFDGRRAAART